MTPMQRLALLPLLFLVACGSPSDSDGADVDVTVADPAPVVAVEDDTPGPDAEASDAPTPVSDATADAGARGAGATRTAGAANSAAVSGGFAPFWARFQSAIAQGDRQAIANNSAAQVRHPERGLVASEGAAFDPVWEILSDADFRHALGTMSASAATGDEAARTVVVSMAYDTDGEYIQSPDAYEGDFTDSAVMLAFEQNADVWQLVGVDIAG